MAELAHATPLQALLGAAAGRIETGAVRVVEAPVRRQVLVQLADRDAVWPGSPLAANRRSEGDPYAVWWAPESRLLVAEAVDLEVPAGLAAHDVTDGLAVLDLTGPRALDLLAMSCGLDLTAMHELASARTLLAQAPVLVTRHGPLWRLHVDRALLPHLWAWASEAATALDPA